MVQKGFSRRANEEWLNDLRDNQNPEIQHRAHEDLSRYLYTVAYNYLLMRQDNVDVLAGFSNNELAELAKDFVQDTLERLARHNFALLEQFSGRGNFTSWVAMIIRRHAGQELRKAYWQRRVTISSADEEKSEFEEKVSSVNLMITDLELSPYQTAVFTQFLTQFETCLGHLSQRARLAFQGCVIESFSTEMMADYLETTPNAIYVLICRARQKIRTCLEKSGFGADILQIFE